MRDGLVISALSLLPRGYLARGMGGFARRKVSRAVMGLFVRVYGVDLRDAVKPEGGYDSLDALFTRELKRGSRPIAANPLALCSPVDATVAFAGRIDNGEIPIAPGMSVSIEAIVGAPRAISGDVIVLYLSPKDYHRVHAPSASHARKWRYLPGTLWPVFPSALRSVPHLFARNERLVVELVSSHGTRFDLVMVGAFGVGRIETVLNTPLSNAFHEACDGRVDHALKPGDPLGVFHLGSTVILSAPAGTWTFRCASGDTVRMGEAIAYC